MCLSGALALASPAAVPTFNSSRTYINSPDALTSCQTATFSWGGRLGAGPPTTGGLPVTQYTTGDTSTDWVVAYPPVNLPGLCEFPVGGAIEGASGLRIGFYRLWTHFEFRFQNAMIVSSPLKLVACQEATYSWTYKGTGQPSFTMRWSNGNGVANRTNSATGIDEQLAATTKTSYTWLVDYPAGTWIEAIITSKDSASKMGTSTHLPGLFVQPGDANCSMSRFHTAEALAYSGTADGSLALSSTTPAYAASANGTSSRHRTLTIALGVVCGLLGIAAIALVVVLLLRRQRRKREAEIRREESKPVVGGRLSEGSFEMGPAGKYVSLD
ncbi:hypothetical protein RQP46_007969 [Phenoliferia psychrophenolica]